MNRMTLLHPHILTFHEVKFVPFVFLVVFQIVLTKETLDIVLECEPYRDLASYIKKYGPFNENHARFLFQQIVLAVDYCHKRKIVVRNIKLDNLPLDEEFDIVKLSNFIWSRVKAFFYLFTNRRAF